LLFDTDVIIDYLRDQSDVVQYLENLSEILLISSIVVAELYSGLRDEPEREALENFLKAFEIVPVNRRSLLEVAHIAGIITRVTVLVWQML
jgi:hypothetical protein